ncbi:peptidase M48 [Gordoniibacillus kamchatkensis]|uniref:Peptidase M48 n=1 Tax=Gordoniibacillus kamchatkensis TaxID=1590651 RepID=A0ABR5AAK1_9BACL|nr:M48 family metallopeptidase [Paenibacillus sp. VKM B-2647]KIL38071.1 peptidase M48 [Paenibacillus sp. VKM B-2647]
MRKRWPLWLTLALVVYAAGICLYFTFGNLYAPSPQYAGTPADPGTFMTPEQIHKGESLSRIHSLVYFIATPLHAAVLALLLGFGVRLRNRLESRLRSSLLRTALFVLVFLAVIDLLFLPLDYVLLRVDRGYGLSNTPLSTFLFDHVKDLGVEWVSTGFVAIVLLWLMKRSPKRWWLWLSVISVPLVVFVTFLQPVVLDPLYNKFEPLHNASLKGKILALATSADIPAHQVYEVNMSARTNAVNAYVTGIGQSARIVLWDTTLNKLKDDEILVIMAHEMGHYKEKHIYIETAVGIVVTFALLWASQRLLEQFVRRGGHRFGIRREGPDLAALPALLLIVTMLGIALTPAQNAFSRYLEHRADAYAMRLTGDGDAAIRAFQKIAKDNLSPVKQPPLVVWFRGTHPDLQDRIVFFEQFKK